MYTFFRIKKKYTTDEYVSKLDLDWRRDDYSVKTSKTGKIFSDRDSLDRYIKNKLSDAAQFYSFFEDYEIVRYEAYGEYIESQYEILDQIEEENLLHDQIDFYSSLAQNFDSDISFYDLISVLKSLHNSADPILFPIFVMAKSTTLQYRAFKQQLKDSGISFIKDLRIRKTKSGWNDGVLFLIAARDQENISLIKLLFGSVLTISDTVDREMIEKLSKLQNGYQVEDPDKAIEYLESITDSSTAHEFHFNRKKLRDINVKIS